MKLVGSRRLALGTLAVGEDVHLVGLSGMRAGAASVFKLSEMEICITYNFNTHSWQAQINLPCTGWISTMTSAKDSQTYC